MEDNRIAVKERVIAQLIERGKNLHIDFSRLDEYNVRKKIEALFKSIVKEDKEISLSRHEQEEVLSEIIAYLLGLGPIEKLLNDPDVSEIMVNGPKHIYIEKEGNLQLTDLSFKDNQQLSYFIDKIVSAAGRRVSELEPYVDARLKDGSRVNIVKSPISSVGTIVTIRKFSHRILGVDDLIRLGAFDDLVAQFLKACVVSKLNILLCGGAGSGKTTLLNILGSFIPPEERVITIEDTRELQFFREHNLYLETRPPNIEGKAEVTIRHLIKNSLHMRPDRIIVGEVRYDEVLDMIQAMNTGHEGSMTTLHANSPLEAMDRLEVLALMGNSNLSDEVVKRQIINALDLVIYVSRRPGGSRGIVQVSQVLKAGEYQLGDLFVFDESAGRIVPTGKMPIFSSKLQKAANYICRDKLKIG